MTVAGTFDPRFAAVREAFARNFQEHGEVGAALAVTWHGKMVVDLWGGLADANSRRPWQSDTLVCMMSVAKGICAIAMSMLYDQGLIDFDAPVARYWPAFAQGGKQEVTVRQALSHVAGVPLADAIEEGEIYDFDTMASAIAAQAPLWPPGTMQVYHSATLGHIIGMLVRSITGLSIGAFVRTHISGPLGADYFIGLTPAEEARCARMIPSANNLVGMAKRSPPDSLAYRQWKGLPASEDFNSHAWRSNEIPSVNGHGSARGVALIYGAVACGGSPDGVKLARAESLAVLAAEQLSGKSPTSGLTLRMGMGFMLNSPPSRPMGPNMATFGHSGAGGAQAFADPVAGLGYCYCCNNMHDGLDIGVRAGSLIDATFAALAN